MAAPMPGDFVRRDEMRKADEDQLERVITYIDVSLDAQRIKTVKQVVGEMTAHSERQFAALMEMLNQRMDALYGEVNRGFAEQRAYMDQRFREERAYTDQQFTRTDQQFARVREDVDASGVRVKTDVLRYLNERFPDSGNPSA